MQLDCYKRITNKYLLSAFMLKIAWSPVYCHPLPANHRFPMQKYELLPEQLLYEGTITPDNLFEPPPLPDAYITNTHTSAYWQRLESLQLSPAEQRRTGFPLSAALVHRETVIANGTVQAALFALQHGIGMNVAGGTHHAFTYKGEGFCLLNDIAIAANYLLQKGLSGKILVVDLDVHQGNRTAQIFGQNPKVFTFSMHGEKNYPMHKEHSNLDIALPDGTPDAVYLPLLEYNLKHLLQKVQPDFVFYLSGADVLQTDKLGRLALTPKGCRQRDEMVFAACRQNKIPVAVSMGGGYSPRLADIVETHANTFRVAQQLYF